MVAGGVVLLLSLLLVGCLDLHSIKLIIELISVCMGGKLFEKQTIQLKRQGGRTVDRQPAD